jgi:hypothetical protein
MSASAWMRRQRDRPIAEHERHTAMAAIIVLLATVAVLLTLTQPASQASRPARGDRSARTIPGAVLERDNREASGVAKRFLTGYLSYTYGRSPVGRIADASRPLTASLQAHPPTVSPAVRARHPRIVSLQPSIAGGGLMVTATVNDGGIVDFRVGVLVARAHGRLLVTGLESA